MKILLPDSVEIELTPPEGVQAVTYAIAEPIPAEHTDAEVLVVWGNSDAQLRDAAQRLTRLRWVQSLAAGPDAVLRAGFDPAIPVTAGGGLHDRTVAEHTLALVLGAARRLHLLVRSQQQHRWAHDLGGMQPLWEADNFRTLRNAHAVIWGFGGIAATLAPHLTALGARVTGVARSAGDRHGFPVRTAADFPTLLPTADVLIMILPDIPETRHALDAAVLARLPAHCWVVNVGRGSTVHEGDLLTAIRSGGIAGAALDVFETEPLPADSGLWDEPNVIISPHAAGGRPLDAGVLIGENLSAFRAGRPMKHLVVRD